MFQYLLIPIFVIQINTMNPLLTVEQLQALSKQELEDQLNEIKPLATRLSDLWNSWYTKGGKVAAREIPIPWPDTKNQKTLRQFAHDYCTDLCSQANFISTILRMKTS